MKLLKRKLFKVIAPSITILLVALLFTLSITTPSHGQLTPVDPNAVRAAVRQMGMDTLSSVILTDPPGLTGFERLTPPVADPLTNPPTPAPPTALVNYATTHGITVQRAAMQILGKALFWDQQMGSDGQACASCHFAAGSDIRSINSLNPSTRNTSPTEATLWNPTLSGGMGGPNYQLTPADFPFHKVADPLDTNYKTREVLFDTDDAVGSIGTFHATFAGSPAPNYGAPNATGVFDTPGTAAVDSVFHIGTQNTRSNGPRQAAPMINAVFTFNNFWDGRADNSFNCLNMHGLKDLNSFLYFNGGGTLIYDLVAGPSDSSLASQSVAPINSATSDEMAWAGRTMPDVGRKIFRLSGPGKGATATATIDTVVGSATYQQVIGITITNAGSGYIPTAQGGGATVIISGGGGAGATATATVGAGGTVTAITLTLVTGGGGGYITPPTVTITSNGLNASLGYLAANDPIIPLGAQQVSSTDSVLGTFVNPAGTNGGRGINQKYVNLVQWAFQPAFWDAAGADAFGTPITLVTPTGFHLMESNFPMFWGLAIQAYETLLRADQSPYDKFMAGDNSAFDPVGGPLSQKSQDAMRGLLTYISTENMGQQVNPLFNNINFGACQLCHSGRELTEASKLNVPAKGFVATDMTVKMDHNRELAIVPPSSNFDVGFTNIGSRPTREDIGIGADAPLLANTALSIQRAHDMGQFWALFLLPLGPAFPGEPNPHRGSNVDGAFKIPHLRNVEMNGPYFHHGGLLTLKQVVEFYARHGDFADVNEPNIDVGLAMVQNIADADADLLVKFLLTLTDERVRWEQAPFDHPQLFVPNGHPTTGNHPVLGASYLPDNYMVLPAVGAAGRSTLPAGPYPAGNSPVPNFMGISSIPVAGPNNDHFDP